MHFYNNIHVFFQKTNVFTIYIKKTNTMCSCKKGSTNKQVTTVKQVVKSPQVVAASPNPLNSPIKKATTRRIIFKRHM